MFIDNPFLEATFMCDHWLVCGSRTRLYDAHLSNKQCCNR